MILIKKSSPLPLRKIKKDKKREKMNTELHSLCSLPNIIGYNNKESTHRSYNYFIITLTHSERRGKVK